MRGLPFGFESVHELNVSSQYASSSSPSNQAVARGAFTTFCASSSSSDASNDAASGFVRKCSMCSSPRPLTTTCSVPSRRSAIRSGSKRTTTSAPPPICALAWRAPTSQAIDELSAGSRTSAHAAAPS
jgi:hypothetical protein